ncbi:hypothetical protein [Coralloluteibacterium stylophorae]|uniref:Uncharacterized protein n=1 Tax=Coralloluteibacterium stylophorae TaxID=1776034 RepID=A0A8J7VV16_9GAMM|nr:hypothetical protein [Coralloluteibacterium stylophorae]MBS7456492.1 hypothetical protein [Coralloluteibacterium stylophorae]
MISPLIRSALATAIFLAAGAGSAFAQSSAPPSTSTGSQSTGSASPQTGTTPPPVTSPTTPRGAIDRTGAPADVIDPTTQGTTTQGGNPMRDDSVDGGRYGAQDRRDQISTQDGQRRGTGVGTTPPRDGTSTGSDRMGTTTGAERTGTTGSDRTRMGTDAERDGMEVGSDDTRWDERDAMGDDPTRDRPRTDSERRDPLTPTDDDQR